MDEIRGKRLLILGSNAMSCDIVKTAKEMGVYTIVTDWNKLENAPAKLIADEYWNDSLLDYEALVPKIQANGVDGIITGFTDSYLLAYCNLCEMTGLPCYGTKEAFEITIDKAKFKKHCIDNDIPVIPQYDIRDFDSSIISPKNKVIIKPVDNSGSRGVIACRDTNDFHRCLDYALSFSQKKRLLLNSIWIWIAGPHPILFRMAIYPYQRSTTV